MGNLTVRNLDDRVIAELKREAKQNERSLEAEIRHLLTLRVSSRLRVADFLERSERLAGTTAGTGQTDSTLLLREDRDR
ncbi:MAG: hypothetical protein J4F98_05430 [Acidobacteria bacterium]|nr:hypothetical protein [Acidobacteriota bacterium]